MLGRTQEWFKTEPLLPYERVPYKVFTREFDRIVFASDLDSILGRFSHPNELAEAWETYSKGLVAWRTALQLHALECSQRIKNEVSKVELEDTTVSILVDQSGSMRGQNVILAAATADIASEFLIHLGSTVEILGFTTSSWRGGRSRDKWTLTGSPRQPGRLCDLLHIVYRSVEDRRSSSEGWGLRPMLRPDLQKENVDGEAVEWAVSRLRARSQSKKLLLVISDGAPVDDSTLASNHPDILHDHLIEVVRDVEGAGDICIAAVGINHHVSRYYSSASTVTTPADLGIEVINTLERLMLNETQSDSKYVD